MHPISAGRRAASAPSSWTPEPAPFLMPPVSRSPADTWPGRINPAPGPPYPTVPPEPVSADPDHADGWRGRNRHCQRRRRWPRNRDHSGTRRFHVTGRHYATRQRDHPSKHHQPQSIPYVHFVLSFRSHPTPSNLFACFASITPLLLLDLRCAARTGCGTAAM